MASEWRMKISLRVKKYLKVTSFLSSAMMGLADCSHGRRMFTPKLFSGPGAFVAGLHDARAGAGDDHETGFGNLAPEIHGLLIFRLVRLRPRGAENRDLADARIRREEPEGITQFAQRGLDDAHIAGVLHVGQQLERVFDDVGDLVFVVAAAFEFNQFLDAAVAIPDRRRVFCHSFESCGQHNGVGLKINRRLAGTTLIEISNSLH